MVSAQGGPLSFLDNVDRFLPEANVIREIRANRPGIVSAIDGERLGKAVVALGGGRVTEKDVINPAVGFSEVVRLGTKVARGDTLAVLHAVRPKDADIAEAALRAAISTGTTSVEAPALIQEKVA